MSAVAEVTVDVDDGVAVITLDNAAARNALTLSMVDDFHAVCDRLAGDVSIGAVVVRGSSGTFCAGLDRHVIATQQLDVAGTEAFDRAGYVYSTFTRLAELPMPTIAAVRGAAVGAGLNLAMAADVRIVADNALLTAGFQRLGLHPGGGFFSLATGLLGRDAAFALGVAGDELSGERAAALGFAWCSVSDGEVEDRAISIARRCAADPALSRAAVSSFRLAAGPPAIPWRAAVEVERGRQMWTFRRLTDK